MNTTTLERPVGDAPVESSSAGLPSRGRLGAVLLAVSALSLIVAVLGAVVSSAAVVLVAGTAAVVAAFVYGYSASVFTYGL